METLITPQKINRTPRKFSRTSEWEFNKRISIEDCIELMGLQTHYVCEQNAPKYDADNIDFYKKKFEVSYKQLAMTADEANKVANLTRHFFKELIALRSKGYTMLEVKDNEFIKIGNKENLSE